LTSNYEPFLPPT